MSDISIIVVDDNEPVRDLIISTLSLVPYNTISAENGEQAWERYQAMAQSGNMPHLIISDVKMPEMDGLELVEKIRETNSRIPIILISGYSERLSPEWMARFKVELLRKPQDFYLLLQKVEEMLRLSAATDNTT